MDSMFTRGVGLCGLCMCVALGLGAQASAAERLRTYDDCHNAARTANKDRKKGKDLSKRQYSAVFDSDHFALGEYDRFDSRAPLRAEIWFLGAFPPCSPRPTRELSSFTVAAGEALAVPIDELEYTELLKLKKARKLKLHLTFRPVDVKAHAMPAYDAKACPGNQPSFSHGDVAPQVFIRAEKGFIAGPGGKRYPLVRVVDGEATDISKSAARLPEAPGPKARTADLAPARTPDEPPDEPADPGPAQKKKTAKQAWLAAARTAKDKRLDLDTRADALKQFLKDYPDAKPQRKLAENLLKRILPGKLVIDSVPEGAFVVIKGLKGGRAPLVRKARAGTYKITARLKGYQPSEQEVSLAPGEAKEVKLELAGIPGTLAVTTDPPGAKVWAGNQELGAAPVEAKVPSGAVWVKAELAGYQTAQKIVELKARGKAQVALTLSRGFGKIRIETKPAGAQVTIDGKQMGLSPVEIDILTGPHPVVVMLDGFEPQERVVQVQADQTASEMFELGKAPPGQLTITSEPAGAVVKIDGKRAGTTPVDGRVAPGTYVVSVALDGYLPEEKSAMVLSGQRAEVAFSLEPAPGGTLVVESEPAGATVRIDDEEIGKTPFSKQVDPGKHMVSVSLEGYEAVKQAVDVVGGKPTAIALELVRIPHGELVLSSQPPGAEVIIGGRAAGKTPLTESLPPGEHELVLTSPGFVKLTRKVSIEDGKQAELELTLAEDRFGTLVVNSLPPGGQVSIDGQSAGQAPVRRNLEPGNHEIVVKLAGYDATERLVSVSRSLETEITIPLELNSEMGLFAKVGHGAFWPGLALAGFGSFAAYQASAAADDFKARSWDTSADDRSRTWAGMMYSGLITGGVLMIAGVIFWALPDSGPAPSASAAVVPGPDGGLSVGLGGGW